MLIIKAYLRVKLSLVDLFLDLVEIIIENL